MVNVSNSALEERWKEYTRLRQRNANYDAFVSLGEISNCVQYGDVSRETKSKWMNSLRDVSIDADVLQSLRNDMEERIRRIGRVVGIGETLIYEEALLVITLRVELDVLSVYLNERGFDHVPDARVVDEQLLAMVSTPANSSAYRSAQQAAKRNWGLPLHSKWLGADTTN